MKMPRQQHDANSGPITSDRRRLHHGDDADVGRHLLELLAAHLFSHSIEHRLLPDLRHEQSSLENCEEEVVSARMPTHRGHETTDSKVAFGENRMPMKR